MKVIIWDADQREIPGYGVPTKGDKLTVPDHLATSLVYQGLAVYAKKPITKEKSK